VLGNARGDELMNKTELMITLKWNLTSIERKQKEEK
jgi:hypothetical protein